MKRIYILIIIIIQTSCYKDYDHSSEEVIKGPTGTIISADLNGKIQNAENLSFENLSLELDGQSIAVTDKHFFMNLDRVVQSGRFLMLRSENQTVGIKQLSLVENDINYIELSTFENTSSINIESTVASRVDLDNNYAFNFDGTAFSEDGSLVTGRINVQFTKITDAELLNNMVDMAIDENENALVLTEIDHLVFFECFDALGNRVVFNSTLNALELSNNLSGFQKFGLGSTLSALSNANTNTIPFNGQGLIVVAKAEPAVFLKGSMAYNDMMMSYSKMSYDDRSIYTTDSGRWLGIFEQQTDTEISLEDICDNTIKTWTVTTGQSNSENNVLSFMDASSGVAQLELSILDCNGQHIERPSLKIIESGEDRILVYKDKAIHTFTAVCPLDFDVQAIDLGQAGIGGPVINWNTGFPGDIRYLTNCENKEDNFSVIRINGDQKLYESFEWQTVDGKTVLTDTDGRFRILIRGDEVGTYDENEVNLFIKDEDFGDRGYSMSCENSLLGCGVDLFEWSHFNMEGGWIRIEFQGKIWAQTIDPPVAGNYPIEGVIMIKTEA